MTKKIFVPIVLLLLACSTVLVRAQKNDNLIIGQNAHWEVTIATSVGAIDVLLYNDTPIHRDNFVKLAQSSFYDHLLFHRVIKNFMAQCGDPKSREAQATALYGEDDAGYTLPAEIRPQYFHKKGALAAAREPDEMNPLRNSSGSHFYIVTGKVHNDSTLNVAKEKIAMSQGAAITPEREEIYRTIGGTPHLDGSYTIFGEVIKGMKVVDKICNSKTFVNDRPVVDIYIKSITCRKVEDK